MRTLLCKSNKKDALLSPALVPPDATGVETALEVEPEVEPEMKPSEFALPGQETSSPPPLIDIKGDDVAHSPVLNGR